MGRPGGLVTVAIVTWLASQRASADPKQARYAPQLEVAARLGITRAHYYDTYGLLGPMFDGEVDIRPITAVLLGGFIGYSQFTVHESRDFDIPASTTHERMLDLGVRVAGALGPVSAGVGVAAEIVHHENSYFGTDWQLRPLLGVHLVLRIPFDEPRLQVFIAETVAHDTALHAGVGVQF